MFVLDSDNNLLMHHLCGSGESSLGERDDPGERCLFSSFAVSGSSLEITN